MKTIEKSVKNASKATISPCFSSSTLLLEVAREHRGRDGRHGVMGHAEEQHQPGPRGLCKQRRRPGQDQKELRLLVLHQRGEAPHEKRHGHISYKHLIRYIIYIIICHIYIHNKMCQGVCG